MSSNFSTELIDDQQRRLSEARKLVYQARPLISRAVGRLEALDPWKKLPGSLELMRELGAWLERSDPDHFEF